MSKLDEALNVMQSEKQKAYGLANAGAPMAGMVNGPCEVPCAEEPSPADILYEAASRAEDRARGLRHLASLIPPSVVISYGARRTLMALVKELAR